MKNRNTHSRQASSTEYLDSWTFWFLNPSDSPITKISLLQQFPYIFVIFNPRVAEIEFNLDLDYNILAFKVKYVKYAFFQDDSQNLA